MKAFTKSQFGYCPLSNKINHIHERALRITHRDKSSTLQEFLQNGNSVSIHHRNVQKFSIEIYNIFYGFSPLILNDTLQRPKGKFRQTWHRIYSFIGPKIWDLVPSDITLSQTFKDFQKKRKK